MQWISPQRTSPQRTSRDHQKEGGPRKEKEQKGWDTNYYPWSKRSTRARGIAEAPVQSYIVSITQSARGSTSQEVHENPGVFRKCCVRSSRIPWGILTMLRVAV